MNEVALVTIPPKLDTTTLKMWVQVHLLGLQNLLNVQEVNGGALEAMNDLCQRHCCGSCPDSFYSWDVVVNVHQVGSQGRVALAGDLGIMWVEFSGY